MRQTKEGPLCNIKPLVTRKVMYLRPAENMCMAGHASNSTQILRQKSVWRPILGSIVRRKVYPKSILGPGATPISPRPKIAWGHNLRPPIDPKIGLQTDFGLRI